jgi:hypothetical protein
VGCAKSGALAIASKNIKLQKMLRITFPRVRPQESNDRQSHPLQK